jgi:hypothetical protein
MKYFYAAVFAVTLYLTALGGYAYAQGAPQQQCDITDKIVKFLFDRHGELAASALHANQFVYVIYINPETQSWTILGERPDGVSCFLAAGDGISTPRPYSGPSL